MANRYSKPSTQKKENKSPEMAQYEKKRERLNKAAKIMALLVALAMIVTAFLSSGVFIAN